MSSEIDILLEKKKTVTWLKWKLFGEKIEGMLVDKIILTEEWQFLGENVILENKDFSWIKAIFGQMMIFG